MVKTKKKKLKKKIKRLARRLEQLRGCHCHLANMSEGHIRALKNRMDDLENDNKYYKEWMDRSGVDYKSWFNFEEKTCDTCKWKPLMEQGGQDIPCMGCTANDKKMWKSKEA